MEHARIYPLRTNSHTIHTFHTLTHSHAVTEPVSEAVLAPLIHLLLSSDVDVQKASSLALSNLALNGPRA